MAKEKKVLSEGNELSVKESIYLDKLKLSAILIHKQFLVISNVSSVVALVYKQSIELDRLRETSEWMWSWQNINELFDALKNEHLKKLDKDEQTQINGFVERYNTFDKTLTLADLMRTKEILLKLMSVSGFHDLGLKSDIVENLEEAF